MANFEMVGVHTGDREIESVRELFEEYRSFLLSIGCDVAAFQGYDDELRSLPGKYSPDQKGLLILLTATAPNSQPHPRRITTITGPSTGPSLPEGDVGCIALRDLGDGVGEVKRLFIRPQYSRLGLGSALAQHIIAHATTLGYSSLKLDTLERLPKAISLYAGLGFTRCEAYCYNPLDDAVYMAKELR